MSRFRMNSYRGEVWDSESLKRTLVRDYPGAKSLHEAVRMAKTNPAKTSEPDLKENKENPLTEAYRTAVLELEKVYDPNAQYDPEKVSELAVKPLKTVQDVISWKEAWLTLIESVNDTERF